MGGLLLPPRVAETQAPTAAPASPGAPSPAPGAPPADTTTTPPADGDLSPIVEGANDDAGPRKPDRDTERRHGDTDDSDDSDDSDETDALAEPVPTPDAAALLGLPAELGLGQLVPSADAVAPAPAPPPADSVASGLIGDVGDRGSSPGGVVPLVAGLLVSLAVLGGGGGWMWWRNRDRHYWPA